MLQRITKESDPEGWAKAQWLKYRAEANEPIQLCDSPEWGKFQKELMRKRKEIASGQGNLFG
jgi:hypothetical protein